MEIGKKLKALRVKNRLTLDELASRSEVTKGFLSQLERDLTSPNIVTLENILEALGTTLPEFFSQPKKEQIVFGKNDFFVDERENETIHWIVPNAQKNEMEPILLTIHPKQKTSLMKTHEGQEFGYVLKGKVELVMDEDIHIVKAKETFYCSGNTSHYIYNPTNKDVQLLWITTPPLF